MYSQHREQHIENTQHTYILKKIENNERKHCHSVILSVYCSRVDAKAFGWASMIPLSHLSFAQDGQVKCRPKKKVIIKVSHSVVAEGIVCVCGGGGGGCNGRQA